MEPRPLHVLLVDDDPNLLATMGDILKVKGFVPIPVRTAVAALAQTTDIDVALIDLHLEDMPGLELLREIRTKFPGSECIMLTGHATQDSAIDAINAGAFSFFQKPCDIDQLVLSVRRAGEKRAAGLALRESEERFRSLYENSPVGIYRTTPEGQILMANPALVRMLGFDSFEQLAQRNLDQDGYEPDYPRSQFLAEIEKTGEVHGMESAWQTRFGNTILVRESAHVVRDAQGQILCFDGTVEDISASKHAEKLQQAVYRIAQAADRAEDLDSLYPSIQAIISEVMVADNFYIALLDRESGLINFPYFSDKLGKPPARQTASQGLTGYVLRTAQSLLCDQVLFESLKQHGKVEQMGPTAAIWLGVPLLVAGQAIGVMAVQDFNNSGVYGEREQNILEFVSSQVAMAIHRKQAEQALVRAEQKYRSIFENATEGIHQTTFDGKIISVNQAGASMLGFDTPVELMANAIDLNSRFYVLPGRREEFQKLIEAHGELSGFESEIYRKDGSTVWISENAHSVRDEQGNLLYYEGTSVDITGRKQAEEKLQQAEARLRALVEQVPAIVYTELAETRETLYISPQIELLTGHKPAEWLGNPDAWKALIHPDDYPAVSAEDQRTNATGEPFRWEYRVFTRDGRCIWFRDEAVLIKSQDGTPLFWQGFMVDISVRKQAEVDLQASRAAEMVFAERLAVLSEATTELSKAESLDALCRRAVELGREKLDFDRLSIWLLAEDRSTMLGTFGVDAEGRYTDERGLRVPIESDFVSMPVLQGHVPLLRRMDVPLTLQGQVVGQGMHVSAGLWDGKSIIGYLAIDNLLRQRPFSDRDCEIIRLYASALGQLISLKRAEQAVRTSEERYRMLAENMTDTIWLMDLDLKTTYISPSVIKQRGYTLQELNTVPLDRQMTAEFLRTPCENVHQGSVIRTAGAGRFAHPRHSRTGIVSQGWQHLLEREHLFTHT